MHSCHGIGGNTIKRCRGDEKNVINLMNQILIVAGIGCFFFS